jgi:hypothetical protein
MHARKQARKQARKHKLFFLPRTHLRVDAREGRLGHILLQHLHCPPGGQSDRALELDFLQGVRMGGRVRGAGGAVLQSIGKQWAYWTRKLYAFMQCNAFSGIYMSEGV